MKNSSVPFFDFKLAPQSLKMEWKNVISQTIDHGIFINGPQVSQFEYNWSKSIGVKHSIAVGNGLDALTIGLRAMGVGKGARVAVPAHTFIASWLAIDLVGATPIGIDVDQNGLLDLSELYKINKNIDVVMPVHMHGSMVDMENLCEWAKSRDIKIIEDASQSHYASQNEKFAGTFGVVGAFSLYPTKNLGAIGDAGVISTNSDEIAKKVRSIANYGSEPKNKYVHTIEGVNSRLDEIQAAVLNVNLKYLQEWNQKRIKLADYVIDRLSGQYTFLQKESPSVRHHLIIKTTKREEIMSILRQTQIGFDVHYPYFAAEEFYKMTGKSVPQFPNSENLSKEILSIPISQWHTFEQMDTVIRALQEVDES